MQLTPTNYHIALRQFFLRGTTPTADWCAWRIEGRRIHDIELITDQGAISLGVPCLWRVDDNWAPRVLTPDLFLSPQPPLHIFQRREDIDAVRINCLYATTAPLQTVETPHFSHSDLLARWDAEPKWVLRLYHSKFEHVSFGEGRKPDTPAESNLYLHEGYINAAPLPEVVLLETMNEILHGAILRYLPKTEGPCPVGKRACLRAWRLFPWTSLSVRAPDQRPHSVQQLQQMFDRANVPHLNANDLYGVIREYPHMLKHLLPQLLRDALRTQLMVPGRRPNPTNQVTPPWISKSKLYY